MDAGNGSSKTRMAGWIISGLVILLLLVDSIMKVLRLDTSVEATVELGYPEGVVFGIGLALLVSTILYAIPHAALLGAILLTGYLGGAIATQIRLESQSFLFPAVLAILAWAGLVLRDHRVRTLMVTSIRPDVA